VPQEIHIRVTVGTHLFLTIKTWLTKGEKRLVTQDAAAGDKVRVTRTHCKVSARIAGRRRNACFFKITMGNF
jgi:hypothetical protein